MGSCILYIEKRNGSAAVGVRKWKGALSVNIAYFLLPKSRIAYLYDDFTFRQGLEKMRNRGYTAIPVIARDGRYVGTVSEGDFLWRLLDTDDPSMKKAEELRVRDIIGSKYPKMDMISFGPTICYPHSPDEKVEIASVGKFYEFMVDTLRNIPKK